MNIFVMFQPLFDKGVSCIRYIKSFQQPVFNEAQVSVMVKALESGKGQYAHYPLRACTTPETAKRPFRETQLPALWKCFRNSYP